MVLRSPHLPSSLENVEAKSGYDVNASVVGFRNVVARLISDKQEFEQTASTISDPAVLKATDEFLASVLQKDSPKRNRVLTRVLLSAFMIAKHPEVLNCESHDIRKHSESILSLLSCMFEDPSTQQEMFSATFDEFLVAFDKWKKEDAEALKSDLQREVQSAESLRSAVLKESKQVQADWIPEIEGLKTQVTRMLDKLSRLNSKSILGDNKQPSNVQIVHDLYLEGPSKFDYFSLYLPDHKRNLEQRVNVLKSTPTTDSVYEAILSVKKALLGLVPEGGKTYKLIDEGLDLGTIKASVKAGQYKDTLQFIADMMAGLCAPMRDPQIQGLRQELGISQTHALAGIVELASTLCSDKIMFDIAKVMPRLPELIVQYERDAFAAEYKSIPLTEAACKKVYKYPGMEAEVLAAELFSVALTGGNMVEMFYLDRRRMSMLREDIDRISTKTSERLTGKRVTQNDPTFTLIRKRINEHLRQSILPGADIKSPRIDGTMSRDELMELADLESKIVQLFKFNLKVYHPVYAHLVQNFQ